MSLSIKAKIIDLDAIIEKEVGRQVLITGNICDENIEFTDAGRAAWRLLKDYAMGDES